MSVTIVIPTPLRQFAGGNSEIEVEAATAGEALDALTTEHADLRKHLYNEQNALRNFVNVYVGDEDIRHLDGAETVLKDGETIMIVPSIAGGSSVEIEDADIRLLRGDKSVGIRLSDLQLDPSSNLILAPGDRVELIKSPRSFTVFGASDKVSQVPFGTRTVSLSEAIARAGGPSDQRANPRRIFLFRFENDAGQQAQPVIYRLDMMDPQSYFLSQMFAVNDKDVIYFSNASSNLPTKFLNLVNLVFGPIITARVLAK